MALNSYTKSMRKFLEYNTDNLFLWVPFIMAFGGALYFSLPFEPSIPFAYIITPLLFAVMCIWRAPIIIRGVLIFIFGFCYAYAYTNIINTPVLSHNIRDASITGQIINIDYTDTKARLYIRIHANDLNLGTTDKTIVRTSVDTDLLPDINDTVRATATLFAPATPDAPGAFDFARWAYFNGITATGYLTDFEIINHPVRTSTNQLRNKIHNSTESMLVDGLVLGYKHAIPDSQHKIWTSAGVGHIWSISGFHMTLIMGWLFTIFYFLFRCIPYVVRRVPAKNIAMICAWIGLVVYVLISGISVATMRAFLMTTLIFGAALMGRSAFSLRNVCLAFCLIFLINPYYIMTAGFQLSFSAIFGLIWFWNIVKPQMPKNKILRTMASATLTAFIASIFTAPFIATHFYSLPIYSIIGNLLLLPIFSFLIMPMVILGTFAALIGLHTPLNIADTVYNFALGIANFISKLPGANLDMPYISNTALCFIILGMMCIVLIKPIKQKINYISGTMFILIGIIIVITSPRPVFMTTSDNELIAFVNNNEIVFNKSRASNHYFTFDTWKHFASTPTDTQNVRAKHNRGLYIFKSKNFNIAYIQKFTTLEQNIVNLCNDTNIDYIVSYMNVNSEKCQHKILRGGFVIYESGKISYFAFPRRWNNLH